MILNKLKDIFLFVAGLRILQHLVFWILSFSVLLGIFSNSGDHLLIDYIYTGVFIVTIVIPVYMNLRLLIPVFLTQKRYLLYGIGFSFVLVLGVAFNHITFSYMIDYIFSEYYFISYYDFVDLAKFMLVFMFLTTLLKLSKSWFYVTETRQKLSLAETEKIRNELKALKSQINPHFMFNSLNNIYSLTLSKSDKAPDAIIKLGNIMRYVIYDGSQDSVLLKEETKILREYIDLQNLRIKDAAISFITEIQNEEIKIAPLIFLPLVENGYKHGIKGDTEKAYLHIVLKEKDNTLIFRTENNKGISGQLEKEEHQGIGLENVRRRLELIYPQRHEFHIFW